MNRLQRIVRGLRDKSLGPFDQFLTNRMYGHISAESLLEEAYDKVDLVYSCITYTARAIAQVPLYVAKRNRKTGKYEPVSEDNEWQVLIDKPNYLTNKVQFVEAIISYLLLDGCVCIIPFPPSSASPLSLWTVRWKFIEYNLNKQNQLMGWTYKPKQGEEQRLQPHELFQVKFWHPDNLLEGQRPLDAGELPVMELYKSSVYNYKFFENSGIPGGVFSTEERLRPDDLVLVKEQLEERHVGPDKAHRFAVLHRGLKWQTRGLSQKDMDFINLRKTSRESIMQIFGMKKVILGETEAMNYATAKEQRKEWWAGTCLPIMRLVSDALTFGLFRHPAAYAKMKDYVIYFDISAIEALHEDFASKVKTGEALFRMGVNFEDINAMLELGFDPQPWYTMSFVPVNMMCINFKDVGRENPMTPGVNAGGGAEYEEEPDSPSPDDQQDSIDQLVNYGYQNVREYAKEVVAKVRRGIFTMRTTTLESLYNFIEENPDRKVKELDRVLDLGFNSVFLSMSQGINPLWETISTFYQGIVEHEMKSNNAKQKKVDSKELALVNCVAYMEVELKALATKKRQEVSEIFHKAKTFDEAAKNVRSLFNASLNEAWPLVKSSLRKMVGMLVSQSGGEV